MTHRTVICVLLALVPLVAGCALVNDGQQWLPTPRSRPPRHPRPRQQYPHLARHPQPWRHGDKLMLRISR